MDETPLEVVVLRAGDAVPEVSRVRGEFVDLVRDLLGPEHPVTEVDLRTGAPLPDPTARCAFVVTGSSSSVTERAPWMLRAETWLRDAVAADAAVLGICFGHQLLGQALGGEVAKNPRGREIGTQALALHAAAAGDPWLEGLPGTFAVNTSHVDTVARLPPGATVLARTELEPHAAFAVGRRVRGVQFHPEFDGDVVRGYLVARRERIEGEGLDHGALLRGAADTPHAADLVRRFVRRVAPR